MKRTVIIDTDPGMDDAIAILFALASPEFDVAAITTVAGNIGVDRTTRNAGRLLAVMQREDVPVVAGADAPLEGQGITEEAIHGDDGLGGVALPDPLRPPLDIPAHAFIAQLLAERPAGSIDILALGPLTNLAHLQTSAPDAARRIGRIIAMGGAVEVHGNVGPRSEFNLACDAKAAAIVLGSGLEVTLIPLDVTRKVRADRAYLDRLRGGGSIPGRLSAELIDAYFADAAQRESRPLHDPCVMLQALRPGLFQTQPMRLAVDCGTGEDRGALVPSNEVPPIDVAMTVDAEGALALLAERLS
jgi:purine nucleosidase